jgi:hypothetical protein
MMTTGVSRIAAFSAARVQRVPAAPAALAWSASSSDPERARAPVTRGIPALLVAGEAVGDQLKRTKSQLAAVQLISRSVLAAGGGAMLAGRSRQRPLLRAGEPVGGSLAGAYGGLPWHTPGCQQVRARRLRRSRRGCAGPGCRGLACAPGKALLTAPRQ